MSVVFEPATDDKRKLSTHSVSYVLITWPWTSSEKFNFLYIIVYCKGSKPLYRKIQGLCVDVDPQYRSWDITSPIQWPLISYIMAFCYMKAFWDFHIGVDARYSSWDIAVNSGIKGTSYHNHIHSLLWLLRIWSFHLLSSWSGEGIPGPACWFIRYGRGGGGDLRVGRVWLF